jgi:peptidoglycan/LPS O-acetylase OafA/YrhL
VVNESEIRPYAVALVGGAVLWLAAAVVGGEREAWDSGVYWTVAYPLSICLAGGLGYRFPERPWRWGLAVMLAQAVVLVVTTAGYSLLPLGLILFSVLALPAVVLARFMAGRRLRSRPG